MEYFIAPRLGINRLLGLTPVNYRPKSARKNSKPREKENHFKGPAALVYLSLLTHYINGNKLIESIHFCDIANESSLSGLSRSTIHRNLKELEYFHLIEVETLKKGIFNIKIVDYTTPEEPGAGYIEISTNTLQTMANTYSKTGSNSLRLALRLLLGVNSNAAAELGNAPVVHSYDAIRKSFPSYFYNKKIIGLLDSVKDIFHVSSVGNPKAGTHMHNLSYSIKDSYNGVLAHKMNDTILRGDVDQLYSDIKMAGVARVRNSKPGGGYEKAFFDLFSDYEKKYSDNPNYPNRVHPRFWQLQEEDKQEFTRLIAVSSLNKVCKLMMNHLKECFRSGQEIPNYINYLKSHLLPRRYQPDPA